MDKDPRCLILRDFLTLLSAWMAFLIWIRFFDVSFNNKEAVFEEDNEIDQKLQTFVAVMATIIPMIEKMSGGNEKDV